jgi:chemotaxis protein CheX
MRNRASAGADVVEEWLPLLRIAANEVFEMMVNTGIVRGAPALIPVPECTAIVNLTGSILGALSLRCGIGTATQIAAFMLKLPPERAIHYGGDALGELANMIAGDFKNRINRLSDGCLLSTPTVVVGMGYHSPALNGMEFRELWFRFQTQPLQVTLEVKI